MAEDKEGVVIVIADIAGQFNALMRLVSRIPQDEQIVLVGDLCDRGHETPEVVEWAMNTKRVTSIMGNHEHMMIDYWRKTKIYDDFIWSMNGGNTTILSYERKYGQTKPSEEQLHWLETRPLYVKVGDDFLITHAPLNQRISLEQAIEFSKEYSRDFTRLEMSLLWNRSEPKEREYFQVFGHNSNWGLRRFDDWAICIDQSRKEILTGYRLETGQILEEPYLINQKIEELEL